MTEGQARRRTAPEVMGPLDPVLTAVSIGLIGFGIVMVYSASAIDATQGADPFYYLRRQAIFGALGLAVMLGVAHVDYRRLRLLTYPALIISVALLVVSITQLGTRGGGAARWIALGPIHVQPSEAAKLALIQWLAHSLACKGDEVKSFVRGFLPHVVVASGLMLLCLRQPDFGGAMVLLLLTLTLLFVAGARLRYLAGLLALGAAAAAWLVRLRPYRWERWLAWLNMEDHRQDLAYQPFQSMMGFGSGELTGLGLGNGLQILYLPKAHTDFIASIVAEELGFIGFVGLCVCYLLIVVRGLRAALAAVDEYGSYLAFGVAALFGLQALINVCVAMVILPTKGLTLPFVSYGGSSLLVCSAAMGLLLNVSRPRLQAKAMGRVSAPLAGEATA